MWGMLGHLVVSSNALVGSYKKVWISGEMSGPIWVGNIRSYSGQCIQLSGASMLSRQAHPEGGGEKTEAESWDGITQV